MNDNEREVPSVFDEDKRLYEKDEADAYALAWYKGCDVEAE